MEIVGVDQSKGSVPFAANIRVIDWTHLILETITLDKVTEG